jgi:GxxExxY protein
MEKLIQCDDTYRIIGLCIDVNKELGFGFSEIVYKDAIEIEAQFQGIPALRERQFDILYRDRKLPHKFIADFVMFDNIIVEIKSSSRGIADEHISQTLNYMKASGSRVGLIINFGRKNLEFKRLVL